MFTPFPTDVFLAAIHQAYLRIPPDRRAAAPAVAPAAQATPQGPISSVFAGHGTAANSAAQAGVERRIVKAADIAKQCLQVSTSLAVGGAGDSNALWRLGHLLLFAFCDDGDEYAQLIGKDYTHPDPAYSYSKARTDAELARIRSGTAKPPLCASYNGHRPGVCPTCPHWGKINSPISLGNPDYDLPYNYRRSNGWVEQSMIDKHGNIDWMPVVDSIAAMPVLVKLTSGYRLEYTHNTGHHVYFDEAEMPEAGAAQYFAHQHITVQPYQAKPLREFLVAWIKHLQHIGVVRHSVEPFTWTSAGFAVGDTLYRPDGGTDTIVCSDRVLAGNYHPRGTQQAWTAAANRLLQGRADIQIITAAAFAAPLVELRNFTGALVASAYSMKSGRSKTAAAVAGQTVWGTWRGNAHSFNNATRNYLQHYFATVKNMPFYLDEVITDSERARAEFIQMVFNLAEGSDKGRLDRHANMRDVGWWKGITMLTTNRSLMDTLTAVAGTDAAALRMFAFPIETMHQGAPDLSIPETLEENAGSAGAIYAAWLARNHDYAKGEFEKFFTELNNNILQAEASERLYVTFITSVILGARFANHLGLVSFDTRAMLLLLRKRFHELRAERHSEVVMTAADILERFIAEYVADTLVTDNLPRRGPFIPEVIDWPSVTSQRVQIQIGVKNGEARLNRETFIQWLTKNQHSKLFTLKELQDKYGANTNNRAAVIGKVSQPGSRVKAYATRTIDINLNHPDFQHILDVVRSKDPQLHIAGVPPVGVANATAPTTP